MRPFKAKSVKSGAIVAMIVGVILSAIMGFQLHQNQQLYKDGIAGTGFVVKKWESKSSKGHITYKVSIYNNVTHNDDTTSVSKKEWMNLEENSTVEIFYVPAHPSNFKLGSDPPDDHLSSVFYLIPIGGACLILILGICAYIWGMRIVDTPARQIPSRYKELSAVAQTLPTLSLSFPKAGERFGKTSRGYLLGTVVSFIIFGLLLYNFYPIILDSSFNFKRFETLHILLVASLAFGCGFFYKYHRTIEEQDLYKKSLHKDLVLNNRDLKISIALLETKSRSKLRQDGKTHLELPWEHIESFTIFPEQRQGKTTVPAYYRIVAKPSSEEYSVMREYIYSDEPKLIERLQYHLRCPLGLEDDSIQLV